VQEHHPGTPSNSVRALASASRAYLTACA
jgi:hypothetical protein